MKALYKFYVDYGRMGELEGIFIAEEEKIRALIDKDIYFGEVLGKHSEIEHTLEKKDLQFQTNNPGWIAIIENIFGTQGTISGLNPLDYWEDINGED